MLIVGIELLLPLLGDLNFVLFYFFGCDLYFLFKVGSCLDIFGFLVSIEIQLKLGLFDSVVDIFLLICI